MNDYLKFLEYVVPATVSIRSVTPQRHPSARLLGTERTGTGAIIDAEGHILTVGYIVMGARTIEITLPDQQQYPATLLFQDFESGIAVLQTPARDLPTIPLGRSTSLQEGDKVIIVAATDQTQRMASPGFISALRPFDAYWEYMLERAILTTAMNPGFGGGPVLDALGQMIGVLSLNLNSPKEMSLAIPIDLFHAIKDSVFMFGRLVGRRPRPWVGIFTEAVEGGVAVIGLIPNGPASRAGIEVKDVILEIDHVEVAGRRELYEAMWKRRAGDELSLTIQRGEDIQEVRVTSVDRAEFYR
ncbi:MAG TPA: S1C family serine protease [Candidatus Tectomicrobia bacterium]|nr:S1C family serine protease [Candidatus Tectomicrobia bacterium]